MKYKDFRDFNPTQRYIVRKINYFATTFYGYMLYKYWCRFLRKLGIIGDMQDPKKIEAKIKDLGAGWIEVLGYHTVTSIDYTKKNPNASVFNPTKGVPLKVFVNPINGEVKMFLADLFELD